MNRRKRLKIPFSRTKCKKTEVTNRGLQTLEETLRRAREVHLKRLEFEFEQFQKTYRLSLQAVSYIKSQGLWPLSFHRYSGTEFEAWLAGCASNLEDGSGVPIKWESRIVTIAAYLLPRKTREEWLGDLQESIHELIRAGCPRWMRILITSGRILLLCYALAWIKMRDLALPATRGRK